MFHWAIISTTCMVHNGIHPRKHTAMFHKQVDEIQTINSSAAKDIHLDVLISPSQC